MELESGIRVSCKQLQAKEPSHTLEARRGKDPP